MKKYILAAFMLLGCVTGHAALVNQTVEYRDGGVVLEGYLAYDDATETPWPAVLVVHEWKGLGDYAKRRANALAELGYAAFAVDMYGKDVRPQTHEEAAQVSGA